MTSSCISLTTVSRIFSGSSADDTAREAAGSQGQHIWGDFVVALGPRWPAWQSMNVDNAGSHRQSGPPSPPAPLLSRIGQRCVAQAGSCYGNCAIPGGRFRRQRRARHFV
eukprot:76313-Chlamydomonas_euryale.AAC.2